MTSIEHLNHHDVKTVFLMSQESDNGAIKHPKHIAQDNITKERRYTFWRLHLRLHHINNCVIINTHTWPNSWAIVKAADKPLS